MAPSAQDVFARLDSLEQDLEYIENAVGQDEIARLKLLDITRKAVARVETPWEVITRMYMEPHQSSAIRASLEMGLVKAVAEGTKTAAELASITECDERLIVRILRPLCCLGIFSEEGFQTYGPTPITKALTIPAVDGSFKFMFDQGAASCVHLPSYLAKTGFKEPEGGCFKSCFNTDLDLFPWLMEHPEQMSNFNDCMASQRMHRSDWFSSFSVENILLKGYEGDGTPLLVDIGGNRGYDLQGLKNNYPAVSGKGKLILQDLPQVLSDISELDEDIVRMAYDFYTLQPVKGARAYYMRYILHDHSDSKCQQILKNIVDAMAAGYSKLLICEFILPDVGAPLYASLLDIGMMSVLSGMERTESQWTDLLGSVGLEVVHFHKTRDTSQGMIEATLKP